MLWSVVGCCICIVLQPFAANSHTMGEPRDQKNSGETSDGEDCPLKDVKNESKAAAGKRPSQAIAASGEPGTSAARKKKRKEADAAAAVDLGSIYEATPGKSKNKTVMQELIAERKKIQKEQKAATKRIKVEAQRQKRLIEKASKLNNEDLLEIFRQRHDKQEAEKAKAKSSAKETKQS